MAEEENASAREDEDDVETLKKRLAEANGRASSLQTELDSERRGRASAVNDRFAAQEVAINNGVEGATSKIKDAKRRYAETLSRSRELEGEDAQKAFEELADIQEEISDARLDLRVWNGHKENLENAKKNPAPERLSENERLEKVISQYPREAQQWMRDHSEYITDNSKNHLVQAAHHKALGGGVKPWSREYFDFIETELGMKDPPARRKKVAVADDDDDEGGRFDLDIDDDEEEEPVRNQQDRDRETAGVRRASPTRENREAREESRSASTAAPPSRSAPSGAGGGNRRQRQPTKGEIEAAKVSFPDEWREDPKKAVSLYFKNQAALRKEGRL